MVNLKICHVTEWKRIMAIRTFCTYDQSQNESFCEKLESVQYKAALARTGAMQWTSHDKIYQELGLESLKSRKWYKRLSCMFKIMKKEAPNYLINFIPKC